MVKHWLLLWIKCFKLQQHWNWNWKSFFHFFHSHVRWSIWKLINICIVSPRLFYKFIFFSALWWASLFHLTLSVVGCRYSARRFSVSADLPVITVWLMVCTSCWVHRCYSLPPSITHTKYDIPPVVLASSVFKIRKHEK